MLADYRVGYESRQASLIGRREVLTGKAKFGIFGDGKEVAQLAMAKAFKKGDWRALPSYYRDQNVYVCNWHEQYGRIFSPSCMLILILRKTRHPVEGK